MPRRANRELARELDKLQDTIDKLRVSLDVRSITPLTQSEATLLQSAHDTIMKGTAMYESRHTAASVADSQDTTQSNTRVAAWVGTLDSMRRERRSEVLSEGFTTTSSVFSGTLNRAGLTSTTSEHHAAYEGETGDHRGDDSDDELSADLAKSALDTGMSFFEAEEWKEADSLFQEALRLLQQLPERQRMFCDTFDVRYRLAVCAYHIQDPMSAEGALLSVTQESAVSDEQRAQIYNAAHLLSILYTRMGQLDRARSECTKALQARRRLLGKYSEASLESTALMAHIYSLLGNRARARSCLAMIPDDRREPVVRRLEELLGTKLECLENHTKSTRPMSEDSFVTREGIKSAASISSFGTPLDNHWHRSGSPRESMCSATSPNPSHHQYSPYRTESEGLQGVATLSSTSTRDTELAQPSHRGSADPYRFESPETLSPMPVRPHKAPEVRTTEVRATGIRNDSNTHKLISRKEILDKVGCQPRDSIEEAVCAGDHAAFARLLNKKKDSWRSKLRKRSRPERVTALHFAALFGEIDMARRLLAADFNVNEVPFGYSTSLTPLKFAIGARQVEMVEFLTACGAKPTSPDSWSTMAGQLMNRSWLEKTMSESEKEHVPGRMVAILRTLLKHGLEINVALDTSGRTLLHQAVGFWTGSLKWDLDVRSAVATFLCEKGADHMQPNAEGKTAYDLASASGDQNLLMILGQGEKNQNTIEWRIAPIELAG